jgi:hypothetical protein
MPTYDSGTTGLAGIVGVTILLPDGTAHVPRATAGITEPVAGSGVYHVADHDTTVDLLYVWDNGVGTIGASELVRAAPTTPGDTLVTNLTKLAADFTIDPVNGTALGITTSGAGMTAYLTADTDRVTPLRHTTAAVDGTWALSLPAGDWTVDIGKDGYYDSDDGDSVKTFRVVI